MTETKSRPESLAAGGREIRQDSIANDSSAHHSNPLDAALELADNGIPVFPVELSEPDANGKRRKTPRTKHSHLDATTEEDTIRRWWQSMPNAAIGVPTGERTGFDVLDVDPDGEPWAAEHGGFLLSAGRVHHTERGRHYLFLHADGVRNSSGKIAPGIDVRGEGGWIVWWPARGLYAYGELEELAPAPDALVSLMRGSERTTEREHGTDNDVSGAIPEGMRNDVLTSLAGTFRRRGLVAAEIAEMLLVVNRIRCRPPLPETEVRKIAESIGQREAADPIDNAAKQSSYAPRFQLVRAADLEFSPPRWAIRDYLEADSLALIFGDPGCGKSFGAVSIACSVATGTEWYGYRVTPGPVIYVAGEGHNGLRRRLSAWEIETGQSLQDAPLYVSTAPAALCDPMSAAEVELAVDGVAKAHEAPALVVIDTLARNFGPGDENSTQDMSGFIQAADMIRTRYGCTVLLIHHTGHADKSRARGAMALKGALDAEYRMDKDETGVVRLEATKMKDASPPEPLAFRLHGVDLGITDDEGREISSAVLHLTDYQPEPVKGKAGRGKWQTIAREQLERLHREHRQNVADSGRDPDTARVSVEAWRDACIDAGMPRQRFHDQLHSASITDLARIEHGFAWPA